MATRRITILGSTGSIGTQTLGVLAHLNDLHTRGTFPDRFEVAALAAGRNAALLAEQARRWHVREIALADGGAGADRLPGVRLRVGPSAAEQLVHEVPCDVVLAAMVGAAGLPATLAAVELGRTVALANKETLVAAGSLVVPAAQRSGSRLLPVDSEHSAVWQCLAGPGIPVAPPLRLDARVSRVVLTASGGPFRTWPRDAMNAALAADALKHPTWTMGAKVTIDSASLMNKALELVEAHWLFGLAPDRLGAVIHPQSIIHAFVEFADGSVLAQAGSPDMRTPIQVALAHPHRVSGLAPRVDPAALSRLDFEPPDPERFPALGLATDVMGAGGTSGAIVNAANEAAVLAFLAGRIRFGRLVPLVRSCLDAATVRPVRTMADVLDADAWARREVERRLA